MTGPVEFCDLTPELVGAQFDRIQDVVADQADEYWTLDHYLSELPEKWTLSFGLWRDGQLSGFAVISRRSPEMAHLHKFMLHRDLRNLGLGQDMLAEASRRMTTAGASIFSLKVSVANIAARRFYLRHGFTCQSSLNGYDLLTRPL